VCTRDGPVPAMPGYCLPELVVRVGVDILNARKQWSLPKEEVGIAALVDDALVGQSGLQMGYSRALRQAAGPPHGPSSHRDEHDGAVKAFLGDGDCVA